MKKQLLKMLPTFIVTIMMFSACANAQIVYTDVNPDSTIISPSGSYYLDLNNDGISDYKISSVSIHGSCSPQNPLGYSKAYVSDSALNTNAVVAVTSTTNPLAMNFNDSILSGLSLSTSGYLRYVTGGCLGGTLLGVWPNSIDRYLGLKLIVGANTYYGWARMQVSATGNASCTIKDYAYNSIPNQPILAGQTITTGIIENSFASSINLFPNPATNNLTIALGSSNKKVQVTIADITGKVIYTTTAAETQKLEVNTKDFAKGIYVVQVQSADFIITKKIIVEK